MKVHVPGRFWALGDDVDTDVLFPGKFMTLKSASRDATLKGLEAIAPEVAANLGAGDALVAGRNFGCGSSREYAAAALKDLGVAIVVARSFARIFYRNAINVGLPVMELDDFPLPHEGPFEIALDAGEIVHVPSGARVQGRAVPEVALDILRRGGLMEVIKQEIASRGVTV
ncbi:MAG TPA: 3-isopropylmalate dehydratase [Actinomycetota bacterium]|nr:3-isopropylmalate dehydratase [Actinomycetota bacterium]